MTVKFGIVVAALFALSACNLIPVEEKPEVIVETPPQPVEVEKEEPFCLAAASDQSIEHNCDMQFWLAYWSDTENKTWLQRKEEIEGLGNDNGAVLKKILLSQGKGTPYKDRLRAQNWIEGLLPELSEQMRHFMSVAIYQPSQELLEMESALVSLSKANASLSAANEAQKVQLEKQKSQIEQLLKIEASIMDNGNGDKL